jgi:hypothetical protein
MRLITSFGPDGYELYGEKMIKSFIKYDKHDTLTVFYEKKERFPRHKRIEYVDCGDISGFVEYLDRPEIINNGPNGEGQKNWRYDVNRFGRKAMVIIHAMRTYCDSRWAWIDADTEFKAHVPEGAWEKTVRDAPLSYLGRISFHPCTSFIGFDNRRGELDIFYDAYEDVWTSTKIFSIPEWHDAFVFNWIRKAIGVKSHDIMENNKNAVGSRNVFDMAFPFCRHKKGQRKFAWCTKE